MWRLNRSFDYVWVRRHEWAFLHEKRAPEPAREFRNRRPVGSFDFRLRIAGLMDSRANFHGFVGGAEGSWTVRI